MNQRMANLLHALLLITIAVLLGFLSTRYGFIRDVSETQRASLSESSIQVLQALNAPVEIVSYARPQGELRNTISDFVERYRRIKSDVELRFVDPDADPNAMRDAGIQVDGEIELRYEGRSERLKVLSEQELSSALLRLSRARERIAAFLEGQGERSPLGVANADLGQFGAILKQRGVRIVQLPLASLGRIPNNVDLLVIANPRVALSESMAREVVDYVERGGHVLWLLEANEQHGLHALTDAFSLQILPGVIVDGASQAFGIEDPSFVASTRYPEHAITQGFTLTTLFPQPVALAQVSSPRWDFKPILQSSPQSWNETGHIPKAGEPEADVRYDGTDGEISGPLDFAFALTRLSPKPDAREQRAVVIGDGDFLSNSFLGNGGNREFGSRVFDWLLADDALIDIADRGAPDRDLQISQTALSALGLLFLIGMPTLLIVSGLVIWRLRRRR
jgi:ABC-type uncharacterized transport system involved in gliding motility auxiliary subunit